MVRALLSLLLLVPALSWAGEVSVPHGALPLDAPSASEARFQGVLLEPGALGSVSVDSRAEAGPSRGVRILGETGGGLLAGAALGLGGLLIGAAIPCEKSSGLFNFCFNNAIGASVGYLVGVPLGVWGAGKLMGGEGLVLATLGGSAVGLLAAGGLSALAGGSNVALTTVSMFALPLAFSVLGYELTDSFWPRSSPQPGAARPGLLPLLAVSSNGMLLGLGGSF